MPLRNVMKGSKGPDVKAIQQGLNKYYQKHVLDEDGVFGPQTDAVVRRFQEANGMSPPDGIVGPITRSALFPLVATTVNLWALRLQSGLTLQPSQLPLPNLTLPSFTPPWNEPVLSPGLPDAVPTPKVTIPPGGRIVVDWQQIAQTQRQ